MSQDEEHSYEPPRLMSSAPRKLPDKLSGEVSKRFINWAIVGLVLAAIAGGVGYWLEGDYREYQEMRHYGEVVQGFGGNPLADEEGQWLDVAYEYNGEVHEVAQIDITDATLQEVYKAPDGVIEIQLVVWPEEPKDPISVAWIDDQDTIWFGLAYGAGAASMVFCMLIGFVNMSRRKGLYVRGQEIWADPATDVVFNNESKTFSVGVNYFIDGIDRFSNISWAQSHGPVIHQPTGRVLVLVDPKRPSSVHLPTDPEIAALKSAESRADEQPAANHVHDDEEQTPSEG